MHRHATGFAKLPYEMSLCDVRTAARSQAAGCCPKDSRESTHNSETTMSHVPLRMMYRCALLATKAKKTIDWSCRCNSRSIFLYFKMHLTGADASTAHYFGTTSEKMHRKYVTRIRHTAAIQLTCVSVELSLQQLKHKLNIHKRHPLCLCAWL